ncbi:D-aminopeptidase [Streptomyces sp. RB5]|uniref:D-aminopeptidase n=1 Tax=Streptomyces smaragdinus TaxID=2585196 RepID=A0A7K0CD48_9ACTN|nr:serine hydrolase domain-containing protein [Streptomyces smaragdinus]MQY11389.1 D-aminopeptidase [Streptomyces smaragdinus]
MLDGLTTSAPDVLAKHGCPSASVAVAVDGDIVFAQAYGLADTGSGTAATPDTVYAVASVTKPLTATAICLAADEGLLDLDAPIPDTRATVRQMLGHRAGYGAFYDFHYGSPHPLIDADRHEHPVHTPGTVFEYANLGYRAATRALQPDFLPDRVFRPLGLTTAHLGPAYPGPHAVRYTADGRPYPKTVGNSTPGATQAWLSAPDLARFGARYESLLTPDTAAAMRTAEPLNPSVGYGLGWIVSHAPGPTVLSHGGGMGGVAAMLVVVPEQRLSVAVLTNSTDKAARDALTTRVMSELTPQWSPALITPAVADPREPVTLPPSTWTGHIHTPDGDIPLALRLRADGKAEVTVRGETAVTEAAATRALTLRLTPTLQLPTPDARIDSPELGLELHRDGDGLTGLARAYKNGEGDGLLGNFLTHRCGLRPA